jgi:adenosylmethionine-8-amino-7-oxononanoate aminotransferase
VNGTERTASLAAIDQRCLWHPFTQMKEWMTDTPLIVERADGCWLVDTDGNRYLDGVSSLWLNVHGHRRTEIDDAIRQQLDRVAHTTLLGLSSVPSVELAERLVALAPPGLTRVFYSDSGSTAVEVALKIAFQYCRLTGRPEKTQFIGLADAYHGDTLGAVSVGGHDLFHSRFAPLLFPVRHTPTPHPYADPSRDPIVTRDRCLAALDALLATEAQKTAAVILEPLVQGAAGMIVHPPGFLAGVAALCRRHDVLLIADEVATGFGRTGTLFACEQESVSPDLMCVAKGLTGGYLPLAATLTTERIFEAFLGSHQEQRTFFHGHSYTGNPLACAAALASLDLFAHQPILARVQEASRRLADRLAREIAPLDHVGDVRQKGLMVGLELVRDRAAREPYAWEQAIGARACRAARRHGVILRPLGPVVVLMPPLAIDNAEIDQLVTATSAGIREATGG